MTAAAPPTPPPPPLIRGWSNGRGARRLIKTLLFAVIRSACIRLGEVKAQTIKSPGLPFGSGLISTTCRYPNPGPLENEEDEDEVKVLCKRWDSNDDDAAFDDNEEDDAALLVDDDPNPENALASLAFLH